ncbi:Leptomycin B resistance protein pmd1 [Cytospora mali]|uniref:Leptomycin B resistance protein pmd1 n=1 Tax=Cytospora mali TaxID=578113 RepID=A0A194W4S8_CYTMA|nr:Leptomycin B resistance protein pmd1 [Valsa mali]
MATATQPVTLTDAEQRILDTQKEGLQDNQQHVSSLRGVLSYASTLDRIYMAVGCVGCIIAGALNPLLTVIYGQLVGAFQDFTNGVIDGPQLSSRVAQFSLYFVYLAIGMFVFIYVATVTFFVCAERITKRLRLAYLKAVLRQNIAFFDVLGIGQVTSSLTSDVYVVHEAISGKVSLTLTAAATCVTAFIITYVEYWKLALVLMSTVVAMTATNSLGTRFAVRYNKRALAATSRSNAIAEEALRSYKHVSAFAIHQELEDKYSTHLKYARLQSLKARSAVALMIATFMGVMYLSSGLSFWQGSRFLVLGEMSSSSIITCSMAIIISSLTIGKVAPNAQAFVTGIASASRLLDSIRRVSPLDPFETSGSKPDNVVGNIEFKALKLVYPSRPEKLVLDGLEFSVPAGKMTAVLGPSGCGKSSIIGLLERFYEPISGCITLDNVNIRDLNLQWLRQQVSLVGQEPVLFKASILENISHGLVDKCRSNVPEDVDQVRQRVVEAAKMANAHDFIVALPQGYDTDVGQMGTQLSGGQRQRIAIARAIISNPKILLLDEATAALDTKSERLVMEALQKASQGRTTVFITHRLSSIRHADQIIVMSDGRVIESGTHETLAHSDGVYAAALDKQRLLGSTKESDTDDFDGMSSQNSITKNSTGPWKDESSILEKHPDAPRGEDSGIVTKPLRKGETAASYSVWSLIKLASSLNRPELPLVLIALACCLLSGAVNPVQSLFFAHSIDSLSLPSSQYSTLRSEVNFWSLMYLMLGLVAFTTWSLQGLCLAYCSEALTLRARMRALRAILRQDVAFFDRPGHTTGALMNVLSTSATQLAGLGGAVLSTILTAFATLAGGMILSLIIGWKLALVCTSTIPIVLTSGWLRLRVLSSMEAKTREVYADSAAYAADALVSIRTVAALCLEEHVLDTYEEIVSRTAANNMRSILYASALYAASQSVVFLVAALGFWYGGTLIADHSYSMLQYFVCFAALVSGSQSVGAVFSFAPDISKAIHAGQDFKRLLDGQPDIDIWSEEGDILKDCKGLIELHGVSFSYENRPDSLALRDVSLKVQPQQTVALVGHSGCGKSTIISLLERFIDPDQGKVTVDGVDLRTLNVKSYRSLISLVGQEPVLYQGTIRQNLVLGVGREIITEQEIESACKDANILAFIQGLPDGFATEVGSNGVMLSGGQKQRLAIARALLRNSPILLLDEATSALDGESEAAVQKALDTASRNRTTITVAHRLRTVRDADLICVMDRGRLIEQGNHDQLMKLRGQYAEMVELQSLEETGPGLETVDEYID